MITNARARLLPFLLSTALVSTAFAPAYAAPESEATASITASQDAAPNPLVTEAASRYFDTLPERPSVAPDRYVHVAVEGTDYLLVASAMSGEGSDKGSWAGAIIDPKTQQVVQTIRVKVTELSAHSVEARAWVDGDLIHEETVTLPRNDLNLTTIQAKNSNVIDCLTAAGVSVVAATAIVGICAPLCAVTVGTGCIACAAGITALGGAYVGKCFA